MLMSIHNKQSKMNPRSRSWEQGRGPRSDAHMRLRMKEPRGKVAVLSDYTPLPQVM